MKFLNRCNGWSSDRLDPSKDFEHVFEANIGLARTEFLACMPNMDYHGDSYLDGSRFYCDEDCVLRITSRLDSEAEFLADPISWCLDALRDCASADHYYTYEKDYGDSDD